MILRGILIRTAICSSLIPFFIRKGKNMKFIKKALLLILILIFSVLAGTVLIYNEVEKTGMKKTVGVQTVKEAQCIIVPGAGIIRGRPSLTLARRLEKAIELYNNKVADRIIVSGDHGSRNYDEVNAMRDYLCERGVPKENVFMDHAGFSTYDTVYRAKEIFRVESAVIVTQRLHLMRALYIAQKLGLECEGVIAQDATAAQKRIQTLREYPARVKAFLDCCILKSKPKYLGEEIPVSGNGIATEG